MTSIVTLDKTYNFREQEDEFHNEYGRKLREIIEKNISNINMEFNIIKDDDFNESVKNRYIDYILKRIINLGLNLIKYGSNGLDNNESIKIQREQEMDASIIFLDKLKDILSFDESVISIIHRIAFKICLHYHDDKNKPSKGEKNYIKRIAKRDLHKCYICSNDFVDEPQKGMEIEHIFPRKYGGSRSKNNLTVCCEKCNKIKDDMISTSDTFFESFITHSITPEKVNFNLTKEIKISLILKQNIKCCICEKHFFTIDSLETLFLIKKEEDDVFHYHNVQICCSICKEKKNIEGIKIDV